MKYLAVVLTVLIAILTVSPNLVGGEVCGNSIKEGSEECDNFDFGTESCVSKGFVTGSLSCTGSCLIDDSGCSLDKKNNIVMGIRHFKYKSSDSAASDPAVSFPAEITAADLVERFSPTDSEFDDSRKNEKLPSGKKGWYFKLPEDTVMIGSPVFYKQYLYFTTYTKTEKPGAGPSTCALQSKTVGHSYLWVVNAYNGLPIIEMGVTVTEFFKPASNSEHADSNYSWFKDHRIRAYLGHGVASQPVLVEDGDEDKLIVGTPGTKGTTDPADLEFLEPVEPGKNPPPHVLGMPNGTFIIDPNPYGKQTFKVLWWKVQ